MSYADSLTRTAALRSPNEKPHYYMSSNSTLCLARTLSIDSFRLKFDACGDVYKWLLPATRFIINIELEEINGTTGTGMVKSFPNACT